MKKLPETIADVLANVTLDADEKNLWNYQGTNPDMLAAQAVLQVGKMSRVINGRELLHDELKYEGWFRTVVDQSKPSGFGLSLDVVDSTGTDALAGARLQFLSEKYFRHAWKFFPELFERILIKYKQQ